MSMLMILAIVAGVLLAAAIAYTNDRARTKNPSNLA
jgi:hypothetical protein